MLQLSAGQHINCGLREDNTLIAWGLGDFVEVYQGKAAKVECIDQGSVVTTPDKHILEANAEDPNALVQGWIPLDVADSAMVPVASDLVMRVRLGRDGTVNPTMGGLLGAVLNALDEKLGTFPDRAYRAVRGGERGACGLRVDNGLYCHGPQTPEGEFADVALGTEHICAIDLNGRIKCTGSNKNGQSTPPEGRFRQISAGRHHSCAINEDGALACWGAGTSSGACYVPEWECGQAIAPTGKWKQVRTGAFHTCAIADDDRVACWGRNERGQATPPQGHAQMESSLRCALGPKQKDGFSQVLCWNQTSSGPVDVFSPDIVDMSGNATNLCMLLRDGRATCVRGRYYNRATSTMDEFFPPLRVPDVRFTTIAADDKLTCGRTANGPPLCFTVENWAQPPIAEGAVDVFPAPLATISIMPDGHLEVRGHDWARIGIPDGKFKKACGGGQWKTPREPTPITRRNVHACALSIAGKISCWGHAPVAPEGVFTDIACGRDFVCGLSEDGTIVCSNREGQTEVTPEGRVLERMTVNHDRARGTTKEVSDRGYSITGISFPNSSMTSPLPQGLFSAYWLGANIECAQRPEGDTFCWGHGADEVRAPKEVVAAFNASARASASSRSKPAKKLP